MTASLIDGKTVAAQVKESVARRVHDLGARGRTPYLVAVEVGNHPAGRIYASMQQRNCQAAGIRYQLQTLPAHTPQGELLAQLAMLNASPEVTGVILQMPLPGHIDTRRAQLAISQDKDVEGIHPAQMGRLFYGDQSVAPCTPAATMELLRRACPDMKGKEAVIVGHSEILGKPLAMMMMASRSNSPTVTVCHVATGDLAMHARRAEILIVGAGVSQARWLAHDARDRSRPVPPPDLRPLIRADMIRPGAVVIDVAINRIPVGFDAAGEPLRDDQGCPQMHTVGDVDFAAAVEVASAITPVPGGVGPVTVAMLLQNTVALAEKNAM